jgi:DivIVA domain-containing protein
MSTSFNMVKKGYDPKEVQEYIQLLEKELATYKDKEEFISRALVEAQVSATNVVEQAKSQAVQIEEDAKYKLTHIKEKIEESKEKIYQFEEEYASFTKRFESSFNENELNKLLTSLDSIYTSLEVGQSAREDLEEDVLDSAV